MTGYGNGSLRAERATEVRRRRDAGESYRDTCAAMGIRHSYYYELLNDPDGSARRALKDSYRGTCETCGQPTNGSNGALGAPRECAACWHERRHAERRWTRETIIAAMRAWSRKHGRPPRAREWDCGGPDRPSTRTVICEMGWANALEAAGFTSRRYKTPLLDNPELLDEVAARYRRGESAPMLATAYGVSTTRVHQWLELAGEPRRTLGEANRLRFARQRNGHEATATGAGQPQASPEPERSGGHN